MRLSDFKRLLAPLQRKIYLMLGRAILTAVSNSTTTQLVQLTALDGETISDVERFQEYGLETYPFKDAEALVVFLNGNRDRGAVICIMDRQYRPDDLSEGEVALYTDEDSSRHRVWLKRGNIIELIGGAGIVGGVITNQSLDPFTGNPHVDPSTTIKASK
jgi:phage gp45-like